MSYINTDRRSDLNVKQDDLLASKRFVLERKPDSVYFYELEEAVVLDVVMDENHPMVKNNAVSVASMPPNMDGTKIEDGVEDYGRIGCIKFRFINSEINKKKEQLNWAYPIENTGISEWPLMNEIVIVGRYLGKFYYSKKLNYKPLVNSNASFITERVSGRVEDNKNEYTGKKYEGPESKMNFDGGQNYTGILGSYFKFNSKIRTLKRFEGDTILESRFGSSIRFGAYDSTRKNDNGLNDYEDGGGNPMIIIRNRQSPVTTKQGLTATGYTLEDINLDGSSIHITSGKTISTFKTTCDKVIFSKSVKEEQPAFTPDGSTEFDFPALDGDQIVINSDRLVFSSKANETFHFSKKRLSMVTDDEFTIDAHKQIVITTNEKTIINSPFIYLGEYGETSEAVLLGNSTAFWLNSMCDWLYQQTEWMISDLESQKTHKHNPDSRGDKQTPPDGGSIGRIDDLISKMRKYQKELKYLQDKIPAILSQRVFTVGGGWAPGQNGGELSK